MFNNIFRDNTPRTSVRVVARGMTNTFHVEVVGRKGRGQFKRDSWPSAMGTARYYAEVFDAPRSVI